MKKILLALALLPTTLLCAQTPVTITGVTCTTTGGSTTCTGIISAASIMAAIYSDTSNPTTIPFSLPGSPPLQTLQASPNGISILQNNTNTSTNITSGGGGTATAFNGSVTITVPGSYSVTPPCWVQDTSGGTVRTLTKSRSGSTITLKVTTSGANDSVDFGCQVASSIAAKVSRGKQHE